MLNLKQMEIQLVQEACSIFNQAYKQGEAKKEWKIYVDVFRHVHIIEVFALGEDINISCNYSTLVIEEQIADWVKNNSENGDTFWNREIKDLNFIKKMLNDIVDYEEELEAE